MEPTPLKDLRCHCGSDLVELDGKYGSYWTLPNDDIREAYDCNRDAHMFCCTECPTYFVGCKTCSDFCDDSDTEEWYLEPEDKVVLCQFIRYTIVNREKYQGSANIDPYYSDEEDVSTVYLNFSHMNQYYVNLNDSNMAPDQELTGHDGGMPHEWRCNRCNKEYSLTDK